MTPGPTDTTNPQKQNKPPFVAPPAELAPEFKTGDIVGSNYEIMDLIGRGGMGNVYRARHNIMLEEYAIKTLRSENLTDVSWKRFQKEAQAIGRMNHPNIIAIYNFGLHNQTVPYYVMAQLQGKTLHDLVTEKGPMPVQLALPIFVEVCNGMGYAHKKGVIHRDLKPPNIVVLDKDQAGTNVKIVDFGIVKISDESGDNQQLTALGEVCGSPFYMSPEQCEGAALDNRSDIYSLGCTIYEVLTGAPPFRGRNVVDTMLKHQSAVPATLQAASGGKPFPPMLERVVARMLAKSPAQRYQSMEEAAQDIQAIIEGRDSRPAESAVAGVSSGSGAPAVTNTPGSAAAPFAQAAAPPSQTRPPAPRMVAAADSELDQQFQPSSPAITRPPNSEARRPSRPPEPSMRSSRIMHEEKREEEQPEYQTALPPHFLRLMVGAFAIIVVTLSALGYWWIQQKPAASSKSPDIDAQPIELPGGHLGGEPKGQTEQTG